MRIMFGLASALVALGGTTDHGRTMVAVERIAVNDNRAAAGTLRNGVLTLRLEAREGEWRPDGKSGTPIVVRAFGEQGKPLSIPGPLIRVPEGTQIHAFVTNALARPLGVLGLSPRGGGGADTMQIAPGATREVRFVAGAPGTYFYRGVASDSAERGPTMDAELLGAFVVDPRGATRPARDRVLVISRGRLVADIDIGQATQQSILAAATGTTGGAA